MTSLLNEYKAADVIDYYSELQALQNEKDKNKASFYLSELFPNETTNNEKLSWFLGKDAQNVALSASALNADPLARNRTGLKSMSVGLSFFREEMPVREDQIMKMAQFNPKFTDTLIKDIFDDFSNLLTGAFVAAEVMRAQVITTGKISVNTNGVYTNFDYGINTLTAPTVKWNQKTTATPLTDVLGWIRDEQDYDIQRLIMNKTTWLDFLSSDEVREALQSPLSPKNFVSDMELKQYISTQASKPVEIVVYNDSYRKTVDGTLTKYIPDGIVILTVAGQLGATKFGLTPDNFTESNDLVTVGSVVPNVTVKVEPASVTPLRKRTIVTANIGVEFPLKEYVKVVDVL